MNASWKTALVTGASSGLGRGLAAWLARRDVKVYAAARRLKELESLRAEIGPNIVPVQLDVSDAEAAFEAVQKMDAESGGLDLVIANAGVGEEIRPKKFSWASISRMLDVNVSGATATLFGAMPGMIERKRGHLVGISSLAGFIALPGSSVYCASKSYLGMLLNSLRLDVEKYGLVVTSIHPGFVKSEMTAKHQESDMPFLLETDDAVERMGQALVREEPVFSFPWQMSAVIQASAALPRPIQSALIRKLKR
jgi:short-subunit dehydrogenase